MLSKKKNIKLNRKKYTLVDIGRVIVRRFYYFAFCFIIGLNIGVALYFLIPEKSFSGRCSIQYTGSALDNTQKSRIVSTITCNEYVDKYVSALSKAGIKKGNSNYTFNDLSSGLIASLSSYTSDSKTVVFTISFVGKQQNRAPKVLKVVAEEACKSLKTIYTKDDFSVLYNSFTKEFSLIERKLNYLLIPTGISILIGTILMFVLEGLDDVMNDIGDCSEFSNRKFRFYKKKSDINNLLLFLSSDSSIQYCCNKNDSEIIRNYLIEKQVIDDNYSLISSPEIQLSLAELSKDDVINKSDAALYVVFCGKSSYSDFCENVEMLNKKVGVDKLNILCIEPWKEKKKHD